MKRERIFEAPAEMRYHIGVFRIIVEQAQILRLERVKLGMDAASREEGDDSEKEKSTRRPSQKTMQ